MEMACVVSHWDGDLLEAKISSCGNTTLLKGAQNFFGGNGAREKHMHASNECQVFHTSL